MLSDQSKQLHTKSGIHNNKFRFSMKLKIQITKTSTRWSIYKTLLLKILHYDIIELSWAQNEKMHFNSEKVL